MNDLYIHYVKNLFKRNYSEVNLNKRWEEGSIVCTEVSSKTDAYAERIIFRRWTYYIALIIST